MNLIGFNERGPWYAELGSRGVNYFAIPPQEQVPRVRTSQCFADSSQLSMVASRMCCRAKEVRGSSYHCPSLS